MEMLPKPSTARGDESQWSNLPTEVLVMIFKRLRMWDLARVRQTCRRWNITVSQTAVLMRDFALVIRDTCLNEGAASQAPKAVPNVLSKSLGVRRYPKVVFKKVTFKAFDEDGFWSLIGESVQDLTLKNCWLRSDTLVALLRGAPDLRSVMLIGTSILDTESETLDFKLEKLDKLIFRKMAVSHRCFNMLKQVCPDVNSFKLKQNSEKDPEHSKDVIRFVESIRASLVELGMNEDLLDKPIIMPDSTTIGGLRLHQGALASLRGVPREDIAAMVAAHPSFANLNIERAIAIEDDVPGTNSRGSAELLDYRIFGVERYMFREVDHLKIINFKLLAIGLNASYPFRCKLIISNG